MKELNFKESFLVKNDEKNLMKDMCNPIYVERGDRKSRSSVVHEIKRRVNIEQPYPQLAIFPEGTNSNSQSLLAFKIGAFIPRGI